MTGSSSRQVALLSAENVHLAEGHSAREQSKSGSSAWHDKAKSWSLVANMML